MIDIGYHRERERERERQREREREREYPIVMNRLMRFAFLNFKDLSV